MTMFKGLILCLPRSDAIRCAGQFLQEIGLPVTEKCAPDVTHLLLPVPSFPNGDEYLAHILTDLPDDVIISGGNLNSPLLEFYRTVDYLLDPFYLYENAAITARCASKMITEHFPKPYGLRVLILGWGRIGKCLSFILKDLGFDITVAARKIQDLAMIHALGFSCVSTANVNSITQRFQVICNTVPDLILPDIQASSDSLLLELASRPGITGQKIVNARGLPGRMAPMESGILIAETFIRLSI